MRCDTAVVSTAQCYSGSSSYYNASGNTGYISTSYHTDLDLSSEDFCIRANARSTGSSASSRYGTIFAKILSAADFDWRLLQNQDNRSLYFIYGDESAARRDLLAPANSFPVDDWAHVAVTKHRDQLDLWIDGVSVATHTVVGKIRNRNLPTDIGKSMSYSDSYWAGWLDNVEIIKGDAVYFETFAPPPQSTSREQPAEDFLTISPIFISALTRTALWTDVSITEDAFSVAPLFVQASTVDGLDTQIQPAEDAFSVAPIFISAGTSTP